jgi:hypothetical protein
VDDTVGVARGDNRHFSGRNSVAFLIHVFLTEGIAAIRAEHQPELAGSCRPLRKLLSGGTMAAATAVGGPIKREAPRQELAARACSSGSAPNCAALNSGFTPVGRNEKPVAGSTIALIDALKQARGFS